MALPAVFSQIIILIYNMADTFYLGKVNNPYMVAGASLILPVFNICSSLAGLTGVGGGALISRLLGENRHDEAERVSSFCIGLSILMTGVFSLLMLAFMRPLLTLLGASANVFPYARQYALCVLVLGGVPTVLSSVMANLLRSTGESRQAGFGVALGGVANILLDPLFMFVLLPDGYEVLGVGVATLLANCISCAYFVAVLWRSRSRSVIRFSPRQGMPLRASILSVFSVGVPSAITVFLFDLDCVLIDKLMASYGDIPLAAVGIVLKAERLPLNTGIGICQGMMPIVAYNYASGNFKRMFETIRYSLKVGLITGVVSIVLYELFATGIMNFFIGDAQTVLLGADFLRVRCLATPLMFASFFTVHVFQGFGQGKKALFLGVMRWAVFNIPMLFLLNALMGIYGVVWAQFFADILTVSLSYAVYRRFTRGLSAHPGKA
ncbi:MAG: polysaccharide biosynthesis C-terminal domain-containing protein [Clostridia bacterium]|nr:polysaccharide biosynthesis C-terminal domain-containing protein [Clostridia bacterium]